MRLKGVTDEDFLNYRLPSMFLATAFCDFKCDREAGESCCQNSSLAKAEVIETPNAWIVRRYLANPITKAIVFGGLEPFAQYAELFAFLQCLREDYHCNDTVVIYTGYTPEELAPQLAELRQFRNIIVKFGRFIPNRERHRDPILGIDLASENQFAQQIS